ncbi:hypothetical protein Taro_055319 [Colocasia esculenta]|uniref:Uncharacterized protein n=1 Tax=Colocasia esculenta TaxID=4460 RepID=A0A843XR40_COLES|nr:hypothetical protein [Colocasia esculenta]
MVASLVGCPRFSMSQAVSSGLCLGTCVVPSSALLVGGTDTSSRHWSPASPFPVPHFRSANVYCFRTCVLVCSVLGEFPTEPVTREAHPYPLQVRARRAFHYRRPVRSRVTAVLGQHLQQCSFFSRLY